MANAKIKTLTDTATGELLAPRTDAKAVRFDNTASALKSDTVEKALNEIANEALCVRKNLLDNPRFKVNQQGKGSYVAECPTNQIYICDRYKQVAGLDGLSPVTATLTNFGLSLSSDNQYCFRQEFLSEVITEITDKTLTLSILLQDGTLLSASDVFCKLTDATWFGCKIAYGNSDMGFRLFCNTAGIAGFDMLQANEPAPATISIQAVKLEIGEGQTLAYKDADDNWVLYDDYDYTSDLAACTLHHFELEGSHLGNELAYGIGAVAPRRNLLDNPRFKVNQRGQTSYSLSNRSYGLDRWTNYNAINVSVNNDGVSFVSPSGGIALLQQYLSLDLSQSLVGKIVTLTVLMQDGTLFTGSNEIPLAPSTSYLVPINLPPNIRFILEPTGQLILSIDGWDGATIAPKAVKLEIGEGQTLAYKDSNGAWQLYDDYDYTADLLECQRYYLKLDSAGLCGNTTSNNNGNVNVVLPHPDGMYGNPTVSVAASVNFVYHDTTNTLKSIPVTFTSLKRNAHNALLSFIATTTIQNYTSGYCEGIAVVLSSEL